MQKYNNILYYFESETLCDRSKTVIYVLMINKYGIQTLFSRKLKHIM